MILNVVLILILLKLSRGSLVLDSMSQNTLYVSSYCPAMKNCIEGSHVICQYYNHQRTVGPLCTNYVKVSITPEMVQQILEGVNKIRMKLATGQETGKDKLPLPRAYGMMRMHWDSELATLAQVLADQCLGLKEDNCRATDKFPNPSQIITLINFKAPNWKYLTRNTTQLGLTKEKVRSSIDKALNSLHGVKRLISTNDIISCPTLQALPDKGSRSYLKLIRGKATHIGCGISAYTRSQILSSGLKHIYNSVQLVCNVSEGPQGSQPVYTTDPPMPDTGFTECGCPEGYRDSTGCLCEKDTHGHIENTEIRHLNKYGVRSRAQSQETELCTDLNGNCDDETNMMILPIFEIHDAPNESYEAENDVELQFHRTFGNKSFIEASVEGKDNEILDDEIYPETENRFVKAHKNDIRNDEHRRAQLRKQRKKEFVSSDNVEEQPTSIEGTAKKYDHVYTSMNNIIKHNPKQNSDYDEKITANDEYRDHTEEEYSFLTILDHLEKAMKNIELEDDEREIFDLKMRKIYEATLKSKAQRESDELGEEFKKLTEYLKRKSDAALLDESYKENESDHFNRRDNDNDDFNNGIDTRLIQILSKKHRKDDYISKYGETDSRYDEMDAIANDPRPRKQDQIIKYDKDEIFFKKEKPDFDIRNSKKLRAPVTKSHYSKHNTNRNLKKNKVRKIHTKNQNQAGKTVVRKMFSYPDNKLRKTPKSPGYRRIFETENERPTLPTTTRKYEKIKVEIYKKKYLKRDRAIF